MENIKTALGSVGGGFEHVVKITSYLTDIAANAAEFREVRALYFKNKARCRPLRCCRSRVSPMRPICWRSRRSPCCRRKPERHRAGEAAK